MNISCSCIVIVTGVHSDYRVPAGLMQISPAKSSEKIEMQNVSYNVCNFDGGYLYAVYVFCLKKGLRYQGCREKSLVETLKDVSPLKLSGSPVGAVATNGVNITGKMIYSSHRSSTDLLVLPGTFRFAVVPGTTEPWQGCTIVSIDPIGCP